MADALGYLCGSVIPMAIPFQLEDARLVVGLSVVQTAAVYLLFMTAYRRISERIPQEDEDPHERRFAAAFA